MKVGGQIPWNVSPICETSQISDGKTLHERRSGQPFIGPIIPLVHWLSVILLLRRMQESFNLERKSYLDCSSDTHCTRGNL